MPTIKERFKRPSIVPESQEMQVVAAADEFRRRAPLGWSQNTIYPKSDYRPSSPQGQCGVTNFGLGIWLTWKGIAAPGQLHYREGRIRTADGELIGEHHAWLGVDVEDYYCQPMQLPMNLDLAGDQFGGIVIPIVVQYEDYFVPQPGQDNAVYEIEFEAPFTEYDSGNFDLRLCEFMRNFYPRDRLQALGRKALVRAQADLWWPQDSKHSRSEILARLAIAPGISALPSA